MKITAGPITAGPIIAAVGAAAAWHYGYQEVVVAIIVVLLGGIFDKIKVWQ
jgi:uncharacterized membrane protein